MRLCQIPGQLDRRKTCRSGLVDSNGGSAVSGALPALSSACLLAGQDLFCNSLERSAEAVFVLPDGDARRHTSTSLPAPTPITDHMITHTIEYTPDFRSAKRESRPASTARDYGTSFLPPLHHYCLCIVMMWLVVGRMTQSGTLMRCCSVPVLISSIRLYSVALRLPSCYV